MAGLDEAVLAGRIAGPTVDGEAEAELFRRFAPRVRNYGLRHLRDSDAADDLVQEVLTRVLRRLRANELREPGKLASFVLGTCRLVVANQRRTARRRQARLEALGVEPVTFPEVQARDDERLTACVARLGERARAVVVLTYYADRSGAEIADELGLSAGNVRVIRHRALAQLLRCLAASEGTS